MAAVRAGTARIQVGRRIRERGRRGRGRAAGVDAGHHRGLRHLRPDRRRERRPAREGPGRRRARVRRPRGHDLLDRPPGPHRRRPLPRRLSLRVRRAALLARPRGGGAARRARRLPGRGPAEARGDRGGREARPRAPARAPERRRRLRLLAPGRRVLALRLASTWPTPSPARRRRASPCPTTPSSARGATCARSTGTSRPSTAKDVRRTLQAYALSVRALLGDADPARARALVREAGRRGALVRGARLGAARPVEGRGLGGRGGGHPPPPREQRRRDGGRRALRRLLRRRRPPPPPLRPARRRDPARGAHRGPAAGATSSRSSWRASSPTARPGAGRTRRRTSSSSSRSTATSRPTRRRRPTSWPAPGSASATRASTSSGGARPSATTSRSRWPTSGRRQGATDLLLAKEGPGRLYYRIGLRYAPDSLVLEPLDRGFTVERTYEGVDDPKDVRRDDDGTWRIRAGARVRVRLTMVAPVAALPRGARRPAAGGPRAAEPGARRDRHRARATAAATSRRSAPRASAARAPRPLVVVVAALVRPPEPARRARRGVLRPPVGGRPHLPLRGAGHDAGHVRRPAPEGRGDVRPRDLRPRRDATGSSSSSAASLRDPLHSPRPHGTETTMRAHRLHRPARTPAPRSRPRVARRSRRPLPRLKVSDNHRFLVTEDGRPFFYLGDTAWELFHRLEPRGGGPLPGEPGAQGLHRHPGRRAGRARRARRRRTPTAIGRCVDDDPTRPDVKDGPDNDYWDHVDYIVEQGQRARALRRLPADLGRQVEQEVGRGPRDLHAAERGGLRRVARAALPRPRASSGSSAATGRSRTTRTRRSSGRWRAACARATAART